MFKQRIFSGFTNVTNMGTNKIRAIFSRKILKIIGILLIGIFLGWLFFGHSKAQSSKNEEAKQATSKKQIWTCSMHPQIKEDKPGKCPICGMDLIPLNSHSGEMSADSDGVQMSEEAIALANIETTKVGEQNADKQLQLYGTIQADERLSQTQSAYVAGRIERLYVNFVGEHIRKGQTIASIYSPELVNAQQELLEALKMSPTQAYLLQSAREKLRYLNMSEGQISRIEQSGKVSPVLEIVSNTDGTLVEKNVNQGDYVNQGTVMFKVANLSKVWAMFDAYESDLPFLKVGQTLEFTLKAVPWKTFSGVISYIDPIMNNESRTAKVRVEISNAGMQLKPEMYATALVRSSLRNYQGKIVLPKSAILWTGKRSVVYVKEATMDSPVFKLRNVELGPSLGDSYVIMSGLENGEEVVTNGAFAVDASAQLDGKPNMMNQ